MPVKGIAMLDRGVVKESSKGQGRVTQRSWRLMRGSKGVEMRASPRAPGLVSSGMAYVRRIDPQGPGTRAPTIAASLAVLVLVLGLACSGAPGEPMNSTVGGPVEVPPWACVPGETQPCPCEDGLEGLVTCDPQGAGFGECDCSPGAVSQGPAPTSTGSGSDTGSGTAGTGDTTMDPTGDSSSSGAPDPSTSSSSSTGAPDPTTSGGTTTGGSSSSV